MLGAGTAGMHVAQGAVQSLAGYDRGAVRCGPRSRWSWAMQSAFKCRVASCLCRGGGFCFGVGKRGVVGKARVGACAAWEQVYRTFSLPQ